MGSVKLSFKEFRFCSVACKSDFLTRKGIHESPEVETPIGKEEKTFTLCSLSRTELVNQLREFGTVRIQYSPTEIPAPFVYVSVRDGESALISDGGGLTEEEALKKAIHRVQQIKTSAALMEKSLDAHLTRRKKRGI
jgi:hypothetical protein